MNRVQFESLTPAMVGCHLIADLLNSEFAPTTIPLIGYT